MFQLDFMQSLAVAVFCLTLAYSGRRVWIEHRIQKELRNMREGGYRYVTLKKWRNDVFFYDRHMIVTPKKHIILAIDEHYYAPTKERVRVFPFRKAKTDLQVLAPRFCRLGMRARLWHLRVMAGNEEERYYA